MNYVRKIVDEMDLLTKFQITERAPTAKTRAIWCEDMMTLERFPQFQAFCVGNPRSTVDFDSIGQWFKLFILFLFVTCFF